MQPSEEIKEKINLVDFIGERVQLKKAGTNWRGLCPFHEDTDPSLVVTPAKNLWHCLGACRAGGSVVDWVMRERRVSFRRAVDVLLELHPSRTPAGLALDGISPYSVAVRLEPLVEKDVYTSARQNPIPRIWGDYPAVCIASGSSLSDDDVDHVRRMREADNGKRPDLFAENSP